MGRPVPPHMRDLLTTAGFENYILSLDERLLATPDGRRALTAIDPLAFALVYLPKHLKSDQTKGQVTFAELHVSLIEDAKRWIVRPSSPRLNRDAYVAPRESGKSTWLFLILPLWAAAHGHARFIAAFAHASMQAQVHLATFKAELDRNDLLRQDFPDLCAPQIRQRGVTTSDTQKEYKSESGFTFMARGIDNAVLGMKSGELRPDLLILDDVEPDESSYSAYKMEQRLRTIQDAILPLNEFARVVLTGTVTMPGSIVHQLVKTVTSTEQPEQWITDENFRVHHFAPIVQDPETGAERSTWPAKWSLAYLESIRHTRGYKKNFANDPMGYDGEYWNDDDFVYEYLPGCPKTLLSVDPTVTTRSTSDPTGLAVVSYKPGTIDLQRGPIPSRCMVEFAAEVRKTGDALRSHVLNVLEEFPHIGRILIEVNQGGDVWLDIFHDMPVPVKTKSQSMPKDVRASKVHNLYERRRVVHKAKMPAAEEQMVSYPKAAHDDMVDAIGTGVMYFLAPDPEKKIAKRSTTYA